MRRSSAAALLMHAFLMTQPMPMSLVGTVDSIQVGRELADLLWAEQRGDWGQVHGRLTPMRLVDLWPLSSACPTP